MSNQLQTNLDEILNEKEAKILPENIKKDVQIFDIVGTLESGSGNVPVKLFETVEEMNSSTGNEEGDLAVVYRSEIQNATVDSHFQVATFPDTVVLDSAITDYVDIRYRAVDSSVMFDCMGNLDSSNFRMDCWTKSGNIRIQYTSSDGITYTRTDTTGNPVDFGTEIYYEMTEMWNDAIGKFIQIGGSTFEGLYQNTKYTDTNSLVFVPINNISLTVDNGLANVTFNGQYDNIEYDISQIGALLNAIKSDTNGSTVTLYQDNDNTLHAICTPSNQYYSCLLLAVYDTDGAFIGIGVTDKSSFTCKQYTLDLTNNTITFEKNITTVLSSHYLGYYYLPLTNIKSFPARYSFNSPANTIVNEDILGFVNGTSSQSYYTILSNAKHNLEKIEYKIAPTQLSATSDYVYEKEFYGKNGLELGTLQNTENLTKEQAKLRLELADKFKTMSITGDCGAMFSGSDKTEIDVSGLDTAQVTAMNSMFANCDNLIKLDVSTFNSKNVTNISNFCYDCNNLEEVVCTGLDLSKVTSMDYMFGCNPKLKKIDMSGTIGLPTNTYGMFRACESLQYLDVSGLDFTGVTNYGDMFSSYVSGPVPTNCLIYVKDAANQTWFSSRGFTNVQIKA